jgi:para-aminobenzoate synthetase component 1
MSVSPERFLRVTGRSVETVPIKGTARRSKDPEEDGLLAEKLLHSEKDAAELSMIVDILRNDLSRVCEVGSVRVHDHRKLTTHANVHHLSTRVTGTLAQGQGVVDLLRATFPGGSITGAPRIRSMEIIDELESAPRGPYCGSLGYLGYDGRADLNIMIRTAWTAGSQILFQGGGGIVADSDPFAEVAETEHKVSGILRALREGGRC